MKKTLIGLIIILFILLMVQLVYFNIKNETNDNLVKISQNNQTFEQNQTNVYEEEKTNENTIKVSGLEEIMNQYSGNESANQIEKEIYTFANTNLTKIYDMTNRKSNNKILQMYDLETATINEMNIYSGEDFLAIVAQIFMVGNVKTVKCTSCSIEENSYNANDSGYTSFNVILKFDSSNTIKLKIYIANETVTNPSIKFGKVD